MWELPTDSHSTKTRFGRSSGLTDVADECASGLHLTFEFAWTSRPALADASVRHAPWYHRHPHRRRSPPPGGGDVLLSGARGARTAVPQRLYQRAVAPPGPGRRERGVWPAPSASRWRSAPACQPAPRRPCSCGRVRSGRAATRPIAVGLADSDGKAARAPWIRSVRR